MSRTELDTRTACACGAVTVAVKGRVLSMLLCCCRDCRKASGTGHAAVAIVHADAIDIQGETRSFARAAASDATLTRFFCPLCGTPIVARSERAPDLALLPAGLFVDPDWFDPTQVIFARSHLCWDTLPEHLPRYETYRDARGF